MAISLNDLYSSPGITWSSNPYVSSTGMTSGLSGGSSGGGAGGGGGSSYLKYPGTMPVANTTPVPYVPPKTSTTQNGTGGGGGNWWDDARNMGQLNGQTFYDKNKWLQAGGTIGSSGPSEADITAQINSAYDPAYQNLNAVEAQYRQEYPTSQAFIENSYAQVLPQLESEQATKISGQEAQMRKGKAEEKNQIAKSRQMYNELRQGGLTRYGGSSSTGEAYGELLGRTTAQQMGDINQNFGNLYQDIEKEKVNINDFYAKQKTNLEKEKQLKLQKLKNTFDSQIRQINTQRASLDSEKAARRLSALQEYSAQARQIQFESQKFQQQLDLWMAAKDEAIKTAQAFGAKSFSVPGIPGLIGGFSVTGGGGGGSGVAQTGYIDPELLKQLEAQGLSPIGANYNTKNQGLTYNFGTGDEITNWLNK